MEVLHRRQIRSSETHKGALTETMLRDGTVDVEFPWLTFRYGGRFGDHFVPTKKVMKPMGPRPDPKVVCIINKSDGTVMLISPNEVLDLYNSSSDTADQYAVLDILDINTGTQIGLKQWLIGQNLLSRDEDREFKGKERPMTASEIEKVAWAILDIVRGGEVKEKEEESEDISWNDETTFDSMDEATRTRKDRTASEIASLMEKTVVMVKQGDYWINADIIDEIALIDETGSGWDEQSETTFDSIDEATMTRKYRTASEIASLLTMTRVMVKQSGQWVDGDTIAETALIALANPFASDDDEDDPFAQ